MKIALIVLLIIISICLIVLVMMQEGKGSGLTSSISGSSDTYWSKNKGKSKDAVLRKVTAVLGVAFMIIALLLSSKFIK
ncbi:MAG: preprotein translocase subunit SecG [Lachnospiraceae bacterium]|nr:preprotein translocase subunit SecG [Lachnospiraceae bacterium]